ncbi:hypothetical protein BFW86_24310 [Pseudomonas fluorescens]|nr:hypothetical protein BFW86_24310 [Pseudomonas fluorescens]
MDRESTIERILISRRDVMHMLGISSTTLHRLRTGNGSIFPGPIKDGPHRQAHAYFVKSEVEAWIKSKAGSRPSPPSIRDVS